MAKKSRRQKAVAKLDKIVSLYIRKRDGSCVVCGSTENLTNGHLFSRTSYSLRWDIRPDGNCHCQCWGCNYRHEFDYFPYNNFYIKKFGQDKLNELHFTYKQPKKFKDYELEEMHQTVKEILDGL